MKKKRCANILAMKAMREAQIPTLGMKPKRNMLEAIMENLK